MTLRPIATVGHIVILAATLTAPLAAQSATDSTEFIRLDEVWNQAHLSGDAEALAQLWHEELVVAVPGMALLDRSASLAVVRAGSVRFTRYETSALHMRVSGTHAVVEGRLLRERVRDGQTITDDWHFVKIYRRDAGGWRVVSFVATVRPGPEQDFPPRPRDEQERTVETHDA